MGGHLLAPVDRIRMALQVVEMILLALQLALAALVMIQLLVREGMDLAAGMRPLEVVDLMAVQVALGMTRPQVLEDIHLVAVATTTRMVEVRPQALVLQGRTTAMDPELVTRKAFRMEVVIKVDWTKTPMESDDATRLLNVV